MIRSLVYNRRFAFLISLLVGLTLVLLAVPDRLREALINALFAQRILIGLMATFTLLTLSLLWSAGQRFDEWVFLLFNLRGRRPRWLDNFMWLTTQLGNIGVFIGILGYFFLFRTRQMAIIVILGVLSLWLTVELMKLFLARARPFLHLAETRVIGRREGSKSFPSGHAAQAFFLASILAYHFEAGAGGAILLYLIGALIGFTRIYIGVHYPRDVLGGFMVGQFWAIMGALVDNYLMTRQMVGM